MVLSKSRCYACGMKRDGRGFDHRTLEAIRLMAVERVRGGERPSAVVASFGFHRTTIYKWLKAASKPGVGLKALHARPATGCAPQFDAASGAAGVSLDQRPRSASVWSGFRLVDAVCSGRPDRAEIQHSAWRDGGGGVARQAGTDAAKTAATGLPTRSRSDRGMAVLERFPAIARQAKASGGEVYFWD